EKHTDFIFSVFSEELGFVGAMFFIVAVMLLVLKGLDVVYNAKDISGAMLSTGCVAIIAGHTITNIAMTTGLFPIVGIPLPFMSYGGSFTLTSFLAVGLLLNVSMRQHTK
ncbi:MAG: FtsW/RodA/SpoVE family cell cycle protein, partial [Nitrospinota bacterium]